MNKIYAIFFTKLPVKPDSTAIKRAEDAPALAGGGVFLRLDRISCWDQFNIYNLLTRL
jgi:hypothetical protein